MPVEKGSNFTRKQVISTKGLDRRLDKYNKEKCPHMTLSEIIRLSLDLFLRERGY